MIHMYPWLWSRKILQFIFNHGADRILLDKYIDNDMFHVFSGANFSLIFFVTLYSAKHIINTNFLP